MTAVKKNIIRICVFLTGMIFVAAGLYRGETEEIFQKAIRICLECIGIG